MMSSERAVLRDLLEERNQGPGVRDLLFVDQDPDVVEFDDLIVFVRDEVRER